MSSSEDDQQRSSDNHEPPTTEIFVNTRTVEYGEDTINYWQAIEVAFPGIPKGPDVTFSVTYTGAKGDIHSGSLVDGGAAARVKKGMTIDVVHSNRS
ncbi:hypothetical protein acdb102_21540 [Acidothermaceae bacterium B102]|nr:hypothetical protein acdb102_21540 [Acidothermaceae bacterium B102]